MITETDMDEPTEPIVESGDRRRSTAGRSRWFWLTVGALCGLLAGAVLILAIRYVSYHPQTVHYHANFAVYIGGQREQFKDSQYYEEVKLCALHGTTPQARVHLHDQQSGVIHVHDDAVTWGNSMCCIAASLF